MALRHNKKRNSGMLVEFFAKNIAGAIVRKDHQKATIAKEIWKRYTREGTELRKELRIFSIIQKRDFGNKEVAYNLLGQIKNYSRSSIDPKKLEEEKTNLIREVNNRLSVVQEGDFFDNDVEDYVDLATIQILLNGCVGKPLQEGVINPALAELEDRVLNYMCKPNKKDEKPVQADGNYLKKFFHMIKEDENISDGLVVNIMRDKVNQKFSPSLSAEQKKIVQEFIFGKSLKDLTNSLEHLKAETITLITEEVKKPKVSDKEKKRLEEIKDLLLGEYKDTTKIDDNNVAFYMAVSRLNEEIKDQEDKE